MLVPGIPKKPRGLPSQLTCPICEDKHSVPSKLIECMAGHLNGDIDKATTRLRNVGLLTQNELDEYRNTKQGPDPITGLRAASAAAKRA